MCGFFTLKNDAKRPERSKMLKKVGSDQKISNLAQKGSENIPKTTNRWLKLTQTTRRGQKNDRKTELNKKLLKMD